MSTVIPNLFRDLKRINQMLSEGLLWRDNTDMQQHRAQHDMKGCVIPVDEVIPESHK